MKIEIWSDVVCPFCYIGKRKLEGALKQFNGHHNLDIVWKSYQLDPTMPAGYTQSTYQMLAEKYNMGLQQSQAMHAQVAQRAAAEGLQYNFDIAKPTNTLKAQQLLQFAKAHGQQNEAEEALFAAYFTHGKDISDIDTLAQIGSILGLNAAELQTALQNNTYSAQVQADINEAMQIGVRGVPFFVFNRAYAVSGAQEVDVFVDTLQKAYTQWLQQHPDAALQVVNGPQCTPGGDCK